MNIPLIYLDNLCPSAYPFVFKNGKSCCKYQEDGDANTILYRSMSCKDNEFTACPKQPCVDNYGKY